MAMGTPVRVEHLPVPPRFVRPRRIHPRRYLPLIREGIELTGVGFFDRVHGQMGVSQSNGIELHPILKVEWQ
jgi:hypothetical protein